VGTAQVFATLQTMLSTLYINDFTLYGRPYRVQAEAEQRFRQRPEDVGRFHVRSAAGAMIPVSALVTTEMRSAPSLLTRFNGFPSATITGTPQPGQSSGQMLDAVEKLIDDKYAAQGVGFAYSGESYQERAAGGQSATVLGSRSCSCSSCWPRSTRAGRCRSPVILGDPVRAARARSWRCGSAGCPTTCTSRSGCSPSSGSRPRTRC
jgi:hypothetical protein